MMWRTQRVTMSYMLLCHIVVRRWGLAGLGIYSCFHIKQHSLGRHFDMVTQLHDI